MLCRRRVQVKNKLSAHQDIDTNLLGEIKNILSLRDIVPLKEYFSTDISSLWDLKNIPTGRPRRDAILVEKHIKIVLQSRRDDILKFLSNFTQRV